MSPDGPGFDPALRAAFPRAALEIDPPDRSEEDADLGVLHLRMDGKPVDVPTLPGEQSDEWLELLSKESESLDVPDDGNVSALGGFLTGPSDAARRLIAAYDITGVLGGEGAIRKRMRKQELKAALDLMVSAEAPFGEGGAHSVAAAFGAPSRFLAAGLDLAFQSIAESLRVPPRVLSANGASAGTASATATSGGRGAASSSSSAGRTRKTAKRSG